MNRKTKAMMVSEFSFTRTELAPFGLESEQWRYMEKVAREDLRKSGLQYMGGRTTVDFGYDFRDTVLTISI